MSQSKNASFIQRIRTPFEGFNRFILSDLREGKLSLQGLPYPTVTVAVAGFIILFAGIGLTLFMPAIRQQSPLLNIIIDSGPPTYVPAAMIPITIFLLAAAWGFLLAGAIRSNIWMRLLILTLFFASTLDIIVETYAIITLLGDGVLPIIYLLLGCASPVIIPIFMLVRRKKEATPLFEFALLFILSLFTFQLYQFELISQNTNPAADLFTPTRINAYLGTFRLLVLPFALRIGADIAIFVRKLSFWSAEIITYRYSKRVTTIYIGLGFITLIQLINVGQNTVEYFQQIAFNIAIWRLIGGLRSIIIVWGIWWLLKKISTEEDIRLTDDNLIDKQTDWLILPAILLILNIFLLFPLISNLSPLFYYAEVWLNQDIYLLDYIEQFSFLLTDHTILTLMIATTISTVWGVWLVRTKRFLSGYFIILVGLIYIVSNLTTSGQPLDFLGDSGNVPADFWWSALLLVVLLRWLYKGELTAQRATSLFILSLINTLIFRQTDFVEEPLLPIFELAGTGVIALGFIWDTYTMGHWANEGTSRLPRTSRVYIYLGFMIIATAILTWAVATQDIGTINSFTGNIASGGLKRIGRPMLYMLYPLLLLLPKDHLPLTEPPQ